MEYRKSYTEPAVLLDHHFSSAVDDLSIDAVRACRILHRAEEKHNRYPFEFTLHPNLITVEAQDGAGKTSVMKALAGKLREKGLKAVILKGSGTGIQDQIKDVLDNLEGEDRKLALERLDQVGKELEKYNGNRMIDRLHTQLENSPARFPNEPIVQWRMVHTFMQSTIAAFLDKGYVVLADRGWDSFLLGSVERDFSDYSGDIFNELNYYDSPVYFPLPDNHIYLDVPPKVAAVRVLERMNSEGQRVDTNILNEVEREGRERYKRFNDLYDLGRNDPLFSARRVFGGADTGQGFRPKTPNEIADEILAGLNISFLP